MYYNFESRLCTLVHRYTMLRMWYYLTTYIFLKYSLLYHCFKKIFHIILCLKEDILCEIIINHLFNSKKSSVFIHLKDILTTTTNPKNSYYFYFKKSPIGEPETRG